MTARAVGYDRDPGIFAERNHRCSVLVGAFSARLHEAEHHSLAAPEVQSLAICDVHTREDAGLGHGAARRLRVESRRAFGATAWNAFCI